MKIIAFNCRSCGKPLPEDSDPRRRYCPGTRCRQDFNERLNAEKKEAMSARSRTMRSAHNRNDPDIKEMKSRALDVLEDEIRDTMREVIKEEITPLIREKANGAVIVMLDMLPKAMARLAEDLDSKDAVARRNAVAIAMKYTMPTVQENTKVQEDRSHTVYHFIPSPDDTVVGQAMNRELTYDVESNYEAFEADWEVCYRCKTRTHPDNIVYRNGADEAPWCTSCNIRQRLESGEQTASAYLNSPLAR